MSIRNILRRSKVILKLLYALTTRMGSSEMPPTSGFFFGFNLQGVKKVRRHCNIPYNFVMNNNTISEIYTIKTHFNISLHNIIKFLQLLF